MEQAQPRIIFQDIDGCLNPADGEHFSVTPGEPPSPAQAEMLAGINAAVDASPVEHFILNSGRPWNLVEEIAAHLPTRKARYVLLEHACVLFDRESGDYVDCAELASRCGLDELHARYRQVENIHRLFDWYRDQGQLLLEQRYGCPLPALDKVGNLSIAVPDTLDGEEFLAVIESLARSQLDTRILEPLQFLRSDRYIDILPGIHKLDGIHLLSAHLQVELDQALAIGDFLNDLPIFEGFAHVMCPANAHPQIQSLTRSKGVHGHVSDKAYGASLLDLLQSMEPSQASSSVA